VRHPFFLDGVHFFDLPQGCAIGVDDGFIDDLADEWHVSSSHKIITGRHKLPAGYTSPLCDQETLIRLAPYLIQFQMPMLKPTTGKWMNFVFDQMWIRSDFPNV
jgi:hypothetical protein